MPLIQQTIKNLIAGISQQPPKLRHAEQLEEQINGFSTEAGGLQKRPPTQHIRRLPALPLKTKVHLINRDENEILSLSLGIVLRYSTSMAMRKQSRWRMEQILM